MPYEIWLAVSCSDGVDAKMWEAIHTWMDTEGLFDVLELKEVSQSWHAAAQRNAREEAEWRKRLGEVAGGRRG